MSSMILYPPRYIAQDAVSRQLTFASFDALRPCMLVLVIAHISTFLEPSTAARTTAAFAKFVDNDAHRTRGICHY